MKRIIALLLALTLLLCGCATAPEPTEPSTQPSTEATQPTTEATQPTETTEATQPTEVTEPPVLYRHPLNGAPLDAPWTGFATAIVINNHEAAMPQHGISQADIFYEIETEGGITRCLGIFSDFTDVGSIGPVRSARTYFNNLATAYDAPLAHCGGSVRGIEGYHDLLGSKISNWPHIDAKYYETTYFFRDDYRNSIGYDWEHTLFTTGDLMLTALAEKELERVHEGSDAFGLTFDKTVVLEGEAVSEFSATFRAVKKTGFSYDPETDLYTHSQYGGVTIDGNTGRPVTFRNVLILQTSQQSIPTGRDWLSYYELVGSGNGWFACGGQLVPITWTRSELHAPFTYTLADGTPLTLAEGKTYIAISSSSEPVSYD